MAENELNMEMQILEAAEKLFLTKGFAMTSTTEIARTVGCNQALVHYYFRTKENLFQKIFEEKFKMFMTAFSSIDNHGGTFLEKLRRKIDAHFELIAANPKLPFLIINELTTNPARISMIRNNVGARADATLAPFIREFNEAVASGIIRPISMFDLLLNIVSLNVGVFIFLPVMCPALGITDEMAKEITAHRKHEAIEVIMRSLKV